MVEATINSSTINTILDSIPECILFTDLEGNLLSFNKKAREVLFSVTSKEPEIGKSIFYYIKGPGKINFKKIFTSVLSGKTGEYCHEFKTVSGQIIFFQFSLSPVYYETKIKTTCITGRAITESITAQKQLKKSEQYYRALFEQNLVGFYQTTKTGEILNCNDAFAKMLKYNSPRDLLDRNAYELFFSDEVRNEFIRNVIVHKKLYNYEGVLKCKDNSPLYFLENISLKKNIETGEEFLDGVIIDITEKKLSELRLKESNERFINISKVTFDVIWDWDIKTNRCYIAESFEEQFGKPGENINRNLPVWVFNIHPEDKVRVIDNILNTIHSNQTTWADEYRYIRADGSIAYVTNKGVVLRNETGAYRMLGAIQDITKRKQEELAIAKLLEEKNAIFESIADGFFAIDNNWKVTYVNRRAEALLGKSRDEMLGNNLWKLFSNNIESESYRKYKQAFETNLAVHFEDYYPALKRHYEVSAYPSNNILSVYFKDITLRKKTEQYVRDSDELRRLLIDSAMDAIICINLTGIITVWNPQAEKIFGWKEEEMLGQPFPVTIVPEQYRENYNQAMTEYQQTGQCPILKNPIEITALNNQGIDVPVELRIISIKQKKNQLVCAFIRDISERKFANNLLKELNEYLQTQTKLLSVSNEELERYAYVASHDLQEPLRMVTNFLQLLQTKYNDKLDETAHKYINFAVDGAGRMKTLIMDLLEFSKISTAKQPHKLINLNDVVTNTRHVLKNSIDESKAVINVQFLPKVLGNESQLLQLFQNLISNAIKYRGTQQPIIEIRYTEGDEYWQFYVKDNGIGVDAKFFQKIFIIFQRLHNRAEYSGTGIGLALCKKIVELHGGKIWLESVIGRGSRFYFTISKTKAPDTVKNDS